MPATSPTTACSAMSPSCASKAGSSRPNSAPAWKTRWASSSPTSARPPPCSSTTTCGKRARWRAKARFRGIETQASDAHLQRIKAGEVDAAEVGALYLDILRDMKGINSHLVGAAAYPLLARHGELLPSRLRESEG